MTRTFCNPLDLPYRYQDKIAPGKQAEWRFREAADPTVIAWEGYYLLFASMSGGFWYSTDLITWEFKATPELPIEDYAPDVRLIDGSVVFCASKRGQLCTFFASTDPVHMPFEPVATTMEFWDPDLFQDDDGRIYLYWGCTSTEPVWGIELERGTFAPIGEKVAVVPECEAEHGWERKGENNHLEEPKTEMERMIRARTGTKPFIEGAYMTKHDGRYYLQYAAPGTENNVYADGVYVGESPLGPFTYQAWNPFSSNPGGFMQGAGHGSTFQDAHGNWWHASTMRISVNEKFERRVGLFPCYFDADGTMHCDQRLACYPQVVPDGARAYDEATAPAWMLLSKGAGVAASASSAEEGHEPELAADENCRTWWAAAADDADPWIVLDMGAVREVHAIQVNLADHAIPASDTPEEEFVDSGAFFKRIITVEDQPARYLLEVSSDGEAWEAVLDLTDGAADRPHAYVELDAPVSARYVRVSHLAAPLGGRAAVSGIRVFGRAAGVECPAAVTTLRAIRTEGGLSADLMWEPVAGAQGYIVRYGLSPETLYGSWELTDGALGAHAITTLNAGAGYTVRVDSFNAAGVTPGEPVSC